MVGRLPATPTKPNIQCFRWLRTGSRVLGLLRRPIPEVFSEAVLSRGLRRGASMNPASGLATWDRAHLTALFSSGWPKGFIDFH